MFKIKFAENVLEYKKLYSLRGKFNDLDKFSIWYDKGDDFNYKDKYDKFACHLIAKDENNSIVGTIRILFDFDLPYDLPVKEVISGNVFFQSVEVSHFATSIKVYENLFLEFLKFIFSECIEKRIENIYLTIPIKFKKRLQNIGFVYEKAKIINNQKAVVLMNVRKCILTLRLRNYNLYIFIKNFQFNKSKLIIA